MTGSLEQRLRLLRVVGRLDVRGPVLERAADAVVARGGVTVEDVVHEGLPVNQQLEGLAHPQIAERSLVDPHADGDEARAGCVADDHPPRVGLGQRLRHAGGRVDVTTENCVEPRGVIGER